MSAALYIRLSREDDNDGPSESVTNQQAMLEKYASDCHIPIFSTYIDDGYSGCTFDRPAFRRMLDDIESGKVNTVITKDLSRLGRDYILTGHYLERYFPEHRIRYISLLDGIDTYANSSANDITPFRAIMNDMYARDISRKITSVKRDKQRRGQFIGGKPVYGYRMHPSEKNRICIDEEAATVVRRIFAMALSGISCRQIAIILNRENILSPAVYAHLKSSGQWSGERIGEMLQNETYLGNMVQGRRTKISYKSSKCFRQKKEDWIVVTNTHEPIVDPSEFEAVQRILASHRRTRSRTYDHPLKGLVFCHECGRPMGVINRKNRAGNDVLYFVCRTYQRTPESNICTAHCVKADHITEIVKSSIFKFCRTELSYDLLFPTVQKVVLDHISAKNSKTSAKTSEQVDLITLQIDRTYRDHLSGILSQTDFERIYRRLCQKRDDLMLITEQDTETVSFPDPDETAREITNRFLSSLAENRHLLTQLVEKIELTADKNIILTFRFSHDSENEPQTISDPKCC